MNYILLGDVIAAAKVKRCGENDLPVLSITKSDGIVLQSEKFKKRIASKDTADYKVVHRGQLVQGIHIDEANFGIQEVVDAGIVSPAYKIWNITSNMIVPRYLEIVLRSPRSIAYYASKFNGSIKRRERLSDKDFLEMRIPCPPIEVQTHSIETLDKVASLISHRKQQLTELDNLIKARFVELFGDPENNPCGWPVKKLDVVVASITAGWSANGEARPKKAGEKAVLKVSAVTQGFFKPDEHKVIPADMEIKKYVYPQKGDLLFSRANTRELVGATAIIEQDYPELLLPDKLWKVLFTNEMDVYYAKHILSTQAIRKVFSSQSTGTSGSMYNVSADKFRETLIPVPPMMLQREFASFVQQTDKSKAAVQKALDEAQTLFDSLMQQYFG